MSDVWSSAGVVAGVAAVALTGWERLDPIVALLVAANIVVTGSKLVSRSVGGLMDQALGAEELERIHEVLAPFESGGVRFHALRTRQAGTRASISTHVLVRRAWTVQRGHDEVERVEAALREALPYATVFTHLEPLEDPRSYDDTQLDRPGVRALRSPD
jgi:cation diffusion facilitator family transporter